MNRRCYVIGIAASLVTVLAGWLGLAFLAGAPPAKSAESAAASGWWRPQAGLNWQWQLSGPLDLTVHAEVYDVDAFTTTRDEVESLHRTGRKAICYVNAGAYETFRPDRHLFDPLVLGNELEGWPGERWLDIRRWDLLEPILTARLTMCRDKGFDGVEPDNIDGYVNESGFPLTFTDQLIFNQRLAALAHSLGLAIGLKNDVEQAKDLVAVMDFAVSEECVRYDECALLAPFTEQGKAVFHVEYDSSLSRFCPVTGPLRFSSIHKRLSLDAWREVCQ